MNALEYSYHEMKRDTSTHIHNTQDIENTLTGEHFAHTYLAEHDLLQRYPYEDLHVLIVLENSSQKKQRASCTARLSRKPKEE